MRRHDPMLTGQLLPDDIGIAAMPKKLLTQSVIKPVEGRLVHRLAVRNNATGIHIASDRITGAAELLRQPLRHPAQFMQPHHRGHLLCLEASPLPASTAIALETLKHRSSSVPPLGRSEGVSS